MRIVIKIGTKVLVNKKGPNKKIITSIVKEIAQAGKKGHEVVLVSSGAVGTGIPHIPFYDPHKKKIAAAIGQPLLMHDYIREAKKHNLLVGQILILSDDFTNKERFKNFLGNIEAMLAHKVLPIINENDFFKTEDLTVGDNDMLSAVVAEGIHADKLVLLTNQKGLYTCNPDSDKNAKLIKNLKKIDSKVENLCYTGKSDLGLGGMASKIQAAKYATEHGIETFIGHGGEKNIISGILKKNKFPGTKIAKATKKKRG